MMIKEYATLDKDEKQRIVASMLGCDWESGVFLGETVRDGLLEDAFGEGARLLLLMNEDKLCSFCTFVHFDEIEEPSLYPWIGFVYTFPDCRGHHYAGILIEHAITLAKAEGMKHVYISSEERGLYEKYGFTKIAVMHSVHGYDTGVYRRDI